MLGTVAHEIGHAPGRKGEAADHDEGDLMQDGGAYIDVDFSPRTILRFRNTEQWGELR